MARNNDWKVLCRWQMALKVSLPAVLLLLAVTAAPSDASPKLNEGLAACSRQKSQLSCIVGCFKCAEAFGRKMYDMGACCNECQRTQSVLVDDGPDDCSPKYFSTMADFWRDRALAQRR